MVNELWALLQRYQLWISEPTVARTFNNFIVWVVRRWHVYPR